MKYIKTHISIKHSYILPGDMRATHLCCNVGSRFKITRLPFASLTPAQQRNITFPTYHFESSIACGGSPPFNAIYFDHFPVCWKEGDPFPLLSTTKTLVTLLNKFNCLVGENWRFVWDAKGVKRWMTPLVKSGEGDLTGPCQGHCDLNLPPLLRRKFVSY